MIQTLDKGRLNWQYFARMQCGGQVNMAAKQEVTAEEELTVKTQSRAPSAGAVLHQVIKSLIRNDLFFSEKMFKNANLMVLHLVSTAILD